MRLLDLIAQSAASQSGASPKPTLPSAHHFAPAVHACPLRLVLVDDLTRCSTALAYAEGDRLSGCLDLVRVPSERLWVEWAESPRMETLSVVLEKPLQGAELGGRAGVLIDADASGRAGTIRSFRSSSDDQVYCAELIADFNLDFPIREWNSVSEVFKGAAAGVTLPEEPAFDALLGHIRFRFDPPWLEHYRSENLPSDQQDAILCTALGSSAFIIPMLFAVFLLLTAKGGAQQRAVKLDRLNQIRRQFGKTALLEHVEVFTRIAAQRENTQANIDTEARAGRRFHQSAGPPA